MFAFFHKARAKKSTRRRATRRLGGEWLEARRCPAALGVYVSAQTAGAQDVGVGGMVWGAPSSCQVTLGGPVNATVTTDPYGNFSYFGPASALGIITATATDDAGDSGTGSTEINDPAPQINGLTAGAGGPGKQVSVSGSVSASAPGGLTVTFSGSAGLAASSATTDANGSFSLVTTASQLGQITATVTDSWGTASQPVGTSIMTMLPQVMNLSVEATGQGKQVIVSGGVSAGSPGGLTVDFSGSAGLSATSATTDANGNFSVTTTASQLGEVDATVTDVWGQVSPMASATLSVPPPQIEGFGAIQLGLGEWEFEGTIMGPDAGDDTVQLSGMASASATPDSSGNFSVTVHIGNIPTGTEYAVASDIWGQTSSQVSYSYYG